MFSSVRGVRGACLVSLVGWIGWIAARFENRRVWPASLPELASILLWAVCIHAGLVLVERLTRTGREVSRADYLRAYGLLLFCGGTFLWYFNAHRVGPLDAQWYQNMMSDFLAQSRAGTFPVLVGSTVSAFNGAVHPFRSAPWQYILAQGVDLITGRSLTPLAIEHITAIASFSAAVMILYVGFARARPGAKGLAWLFAVLYAMSPAATVPFFQYDMYMTLTAQPMMVAALLCVRQAVEEKSSHAWGWLGVFSAWLWYCHPPMALLTNMVAGAIVAGHLAVRGPSVRRWMGAASSLAIFAALALPYFSSMSELAQNESPLIADVCMPALGLGLCLFATAGFLRTRSLFWLALLPTAISCLWEFQRSLVPFSVCFALAVAAMAWLTRLRSRDFDAVLVMGSALIAAIVAVGIFPKTSIPEIPWLSEGMGQIAANWKHFFEPIFSTGTRIQPGFLFWYLLIGMILLIHKSDSPFAQLAAGAGLALAVALGFCGALSRFLWLNMPADITGVVGYAYDLRILPVLAVVIGTGGFFWITSVRHTHARLGRILLAGILVLAPWSLCEHGFVLHAVRDFKLNDIETANRNRSENIVLERYSWDLLPPPRYMDFGAMDPRLETRFWSDSNHEAAAIDADQIERALEVRDQAPIKVIATPISTAKAWLTLDPRIELDPGQHVLLRFDFLGRSPTGSLVVQGQSIYREYLLPSSGRDYGFGAAPGNSGTLSLWNSGTAHESVQLLMSRSGPHAFDPPEPGPYCLLSVTPYDPKRAPIELYSLTPLHLRVNAPTAGYIETFRSLIPGYKAYLDDKPALIHGSRNALVSVRVSPGLHDLHVRFAGTERLHTAIRMAGVLWLTVAAAAVIQLAAMCRDNRREPSMP